MEGYRMKILKIVFVVNFLLCCTGCGIVGNLASERTSEKKVSAEYNLKAAGHKKILVYVYSKKSGRGSAVMGEYLTRAINARIALMAINPKKTAVVSYAQAQNLGAAGGSARPLPANLAKTFGADAVMIVEMTKYKLSAITGSGFYTGLLQSKATLYNSSGQAIWPMSGFGKNATVGFDVESSGSDGAMKRLANATAHCIVRNLYNCPKDQFKIFEETAGAGIESW